MPAASGTLSTPSGPLFPAACCPATTARVIVIPLADRLLRRDLALNWNVDIAKELEQYLNEVELIEVSFDEGGTALNFAEAALLIQGSTCVYSRKVEYLYQLVFRVLDIITDRQRKLDGPEGAENNEDPDAAFPDEPGFIALDDIQAAKRSAIDMVEKEGGENEADNTVMVRSPVILMQINLESDLQSNDPNKDFKLASAAVHSSGALLLEPRYQSMLDNSLQVSYLFSSLVRTAAYSSFCRSQFKIAQPLHSAILLPYACRMDKDCTSWAMNFMNGILHFHRSLKC